jgi:methylated-DNA-[protein]-cysteine S-methyltransferase
VSNAAGLPERRRGAPAWDVIEITGVPGLPGGQLALLARLPADRGAHGTHGSPGSPGSHDSESSGNAEITRIGPGADDAEGATEDAGGGSGALAELHLFPSAAAAEQAAGAAPRRPEVAPLPEVRRQLAEYFAGRRQTFSLPLAPWGTTFERRVWQELCAIPHGETRSYAEVARAIGHPDACRAVGRANGRNPIAVVIPCHRVIGSDGSLTGYGGGLPLKRFLLDLEGARSAGRGRPAGPPQLALPL